MHNIKATQCVSGSFWSAVFINSGINTNLIQEIKVWYVNYVCIRTHALIKQKNDSSV